MADIDGIVKHIWKDIEWADVINPIKKWDLDGFNVDDPPRPSNFVYNHAAITHCIMCDEQLTDNDLLPYHTPHAFYGRPPEGKDCTPSCMWCAQVFGSKAELEAHEAECQ